MPFLFSYLHYFSNITFSCSADRPYKISIDDAHYIKQFGKIYIKTIVSQIESPFFFQKLLQMLPNLNLSLH